MWHVANQTPFAADYGWVMDKDGNKTWLVVAKATFDIQGDGRCRLAAENEPVHTMPVAHGELGKSSLRYEGDLAGVKPTTDVLVLGEARAPRGRSVASMQVSLRVGSREKRLLVTGDRHWISGAFGPRISDPQPFESMPVTFERAYGGWDRSSSDPADHRLDERNPVGTGFALHAKACDGLRLPNIEYPSQRISSWKDHPEPAGLNVVDVAWLPRRRLAGTYDDAWRRRRFPLWAEDFDPSYHNCSPVDQRQPSFLRGGEAMEVHGMSYDRPVAFELPRVELMFRTRFGSERIDQPGLLCSVIIEPNAGRLLMCWQSFLVCNRRADELDETLITERFAH